MPFFSKTEYLATPAQVWIWTALTVVVTLVAFGIFTYIVSRQTKTASDSGNRNPPQDEEFGVATTVPVLSQCQSISKATGLETK